MPMNKKIAIDILKIAGSASALTVAFIAGRKSNEVKEKYAGALWVDESAPNEQPLLYLVPEIDINEISKSQVVKFKVMVKK